LSNTKTKPLVEGALLSALTIILSISSVYIPLIGIFLTFLWPVPIIVLCIRHGIRISIMATIVSGLVVAMMTEPLQAFTIVLGFGLIGITLGYAFKQKYTPGKTLLLGAGASILSKIILFALAMLILNINPLVTQMEIFKESLDSVVRFYSTMGMNNQQLQVLKENFNNMFQLLHIMLPGILIMASFFDAFINFSVAGLVLKRLGHKVGSIPPMREWRMPVFSVPMFLSGIAMMLLYRYYQIPVLRYLGINVQLVFSLVLMLQGLVVVNFYLSRFNTHKIVVAVIFMFILFNPFLSQIAVWVGLFDLLFDFRKQRYA